MPEMPSKSKGKYQKSVIVPAIFKAVEAGDPGDYRGVHRLEVYKRVEEATGYSNPARMAIVMDVLEASGALVKAGLRYRIGTMPEVPSKANYDLLSKSILDIVSENDSGYGSSMSALKVIEQVEKKCNYKNAGTVRLMLATMVSVGVLDGFVKDGVVETVRMPKPGKGAAGFDAADMKKRFQEQLETVRKQTEQRVKEMQAAMEAAQKAAADAKGKERIVEVRLLDAKGKTKKVTKALFHTQFEQLTELATARKNIFLYGPTGSGKTFVCQQLANTLGMDFSFVSCTGGLSEGQLMGRLLPLGTGGKFIYIPSEYVERYEKGGLFLFDEFDAMDPNTLLTVNTSLAGDRMALPNRPDKPYAIRHKDFVCVAASNTLGTGATRQYTGRHKLDGSTLDRFIIGKVFIDYDDHLEAALCPDVELRLRLTLYRKGINEHDLERAVSTRFMKDAYDMMTSHGWTYDEVDNALFLGWREDEINRVRSYRKQHEGAMRLKMVLPKVTAEGTPAEEGKDVPF